MHDVEAPAAVDRRRVSPAAVLAVVGFSVFVAADDLTVVSTMLRPIIGDLGLVLPDGLDDAAWIVNAYLIAFVAVMPLAGRVSDLVGRRRTFVAAYVVFLAGTIVVPLADSLGTLLAGRVLTGDFGSGTSADYDVMRDGRLLVLEAVPGSSRMVVVVNWITEFLARVK